MWFLIILDILMLTAVTVVFSITFPVVATMVFIALILVALFFILIIVVRSAN